MALSRRALIGAACIAVWSGRGVRAESGTGLLQRLSSHPLVCAHRGWRDPMRFENDLAEFTRTTASGPFMLELDVARSSDGKIVLMHDRTVDRTTDGTGAVADLSDAALRGLHLRRGSVISHDAVPDFATVLNWAADTPSALLMLDIKDLAPDQGKRPEPSRSPL